MPETRVFTIEGASVAAGGTETLTDSDNESWVIDTIQVREAAGTALNDSTATLSIAGDSFTDTNVIISALQETHSDLPELSVEWPSNRTFEFDWTNNSGAAATVNVLLWVSPMAGGAQ